MDLTKEKDKKISEYIDSDEEKIEISYGAIIDFTENGRLISQHVENPNCFQLCSFYNCGIGKNIKQKIKNSKNKECYKKSFEELIKADKIIKTGDFCYKYEIE